MQAELVAKGLIACWLCRDGFAAEKNVSPVNSGRAQQSLLVIPNNGHCQQLCQDAGASLVLFLGETKWLACCGCGGKERLSR
jgi:hypothetical protein